jgi:F-type H+-transporting ATPase subunit gamma
MRTGGTSKAVGFIVVTTDKGLCGGLNTNVLRAVTNKMKEVQTAGGTIQAVAIGNKGFGFLNRIGANVVSHAIQLGDAPQLDKLIGPVKVMLDAFVEGKLDAVHLCYTKFINTMKQEPVVEQLLPLSASRLEQTGGREVAVRLGLHLRARRADRHRRPADALHRSAGLPGRGREHGQRAERAHGGHEGRHRQRRHLIGELKLIYNKTRQAAITKELSEIVSGAAAISG